MPVAWKKMLLEGDAASVFTQLTDVPAAYTGKSLDLVRVNVGETALEFVSAGGFTDDKKVMTSAADTTPGYLGHKILVDTDYFTQAIGTPAGDEQVTITLSIAHLVNFGGYQAQNVVLHTVADAAALAALTAAVGKIAWQTDTLHPYVCTSV
jgi:hypothetical protein